MKETEFLDIDSLAAILRQVTFMSLTSCMGNTPWCSPVFFAFDKNFNFYWKSSPLARHSKNIEHNPNTSIVIYNSMAADGDGWGIYLEGISEIVSDPSEIEKAHDISCIRAGNHHAIDWLLKNDCPRKFYRFSPKHAWTNGAEKINGVWVDIRKQIDILELQKAFYGE